ncbi:MAG: hypothetical protein FWD26_01880 [Treponema sp.]|nr:hypothetical protein [Treponema sp.]
MRQIWLLRSSMFLAALLLASCGKTVLQENLLDFSSPVKLDFSFNDPVPPNSSLVVEYDFIVSPSREAKEKCRIVLDTGTSSWELPMDISSVVHYSIPLEESFAGSFSIALEGSAESEAVFRLKSFKLSEKKFGFYYDKEKEYYFKSPFVYKDEDFNFIIDVPESFINGTFAEAEAEFSGTVVLKIADRIIETLPGTEKLYLPPGFAPAGKAVLFGEEVSSFILKFSEKPVFPQPIKADPALVILWPRGNWRNPGYEVFRWDRFPSLLIIDFADYRVQDRMLKRLAFFVEKAGFHGRLSHDEEIEGLHGWNAHDYRAEDLARFFDMVRKTNFPILEEEKELEKILFNEGIIREEHGSIAAGEGAILSISRASAGFMRYRYMNHEGFHGIFFIDEEFRDYSRSRWEQFPQDAKDFILIYFEVQNYDLENDYLMVKEFKSHVLQQPVFETADYYGRHLAWRVGVIPSPSVVSAFVAEANTFSEYVNKRWGLATGRVWGLAVNPF